MSVCSQHTVSRAGRSLLIRNFRRRARDGTKLSSSSSHTQESYIMFATTWPRLSLLTEYGVGLAPPAEAAAAAVRSCFCTSPRERDNSEDAVPDIADKYRSKWG